MADQQVFRFLDLPTELRLMVYKFLPVKTIHHVVRTNDFAFWLNNPHYHYTNLPERFLEKGAQFETPSSKWPVYSMTIVRKKIPGLAILSTSQKIHLEAGEVLQPKLRAISKLPAQIIVNSISLGSFAMDDVVSRLSYANTTYWTSKSRLLDWRVAAPELRPGNEPRSRPVHVAIRNSFIDKDIADASTDNFRMQCLRNCFYWSLRNESAIHAASCPTDGSFPHIDQHLHLRMAGLTPQEEKAYGIFRPLDRESFGRCCRCRSTSLIDSGEIIGGEEWEDEWAEHESYQQGLV
ncbi:hypothetical protein J4E93_006718 [Alternaria ventricosa]|uniref:uncharacterized protein n=1 Tax=Alternaria ventricosa TaxID=1187951 RepID=UPI0020C24D4E|nr:uncharacterized protein J4E93_006718 [Alternaria ventricosa]KAI4643706.1 hypothetical protein J4E93_006718 [Alternaria ventricosa]